MKSDILREMESARQAVNWRLLKTAFSALFLAGAVAFIVGIQGDEARRAWTAYLTNYVYWTGLAFGLFLLAPILVTTNATWGRPVKRLAESVSAFLPVTFALYWVLFFGKEHLFWWVLNPESQKAPWLNVPFFFTRDSMGLLAMTASALLFAYHSVQSDLELARGVNSDVDRHARVQSTIAPIYIILYAVFLSILSFDLIMSLSPTWYSTLFGAYFFVVSFYAGLACLIFLSALAVWNMGVGKYIETKQFHDMGKLLFAFCVVSMDFFYVQFLVIWYGNLPEETRYVITRVILDPWALLAWLVLLVVFVIPFVTLVIRRIKMRPSLMIFVASWILTGIWFEKYLLVAPSVLKESRLPLGLLELLISAGFLGLFAFCICWFWERYPILAVTDPVFGRALEPEEEEVDVV